MNNTATLTASTCQLDFAAFARIVSAINEQNLAGEINRYEGMSGFNPDSGYTYILLEGNVTVVSNSFSDSVEYLVTNYEDGEETFFDTYKEALEFSESLEEQE